MGAQDQRPRFYEGQYLSADDLAAIIEYQRAADARHVLGAHTWGIAAGLTLTEKTLSGTPDKVQVTLQPGLAWDGYGRVILVSQPTRLPEDLFKDIKRDPALDDPAPPATATGRLVPVWLQYQETGARQPAPGMETCLTDDQSSRVRESFQFIVGDMAEGPEQRGQVHIGAVAVEATQAMRRFDPNAEIRWDASVPHQEFPIDSRPPRRWLVPIGYVRWVVRPGGLGYFIRRDKITDPDVEALTRDFRRCIGAVAEYIESACGAIVLHRRSERPDLAFTEGGGLRRTFGRFAALRASAPDREELRDGLQKDLVWVEGNLRVEGDAKMAGGQLHFRDGEGLDHETPLYMERSGDGGALEGNRELRVVIGPADQSDNRFIVGREDGANPPGISPHLVVISEGKVGVNTFTPTAKLEVNGDWTGDEGAVRVSGDKPAIRFSGGMPADDQNWLLQVGSDGPGNFQIAHREAASSWKGVLHATPSLRIGVGTPAPRNPLGVRGAGTSEELISFEAPDGTTKWHLNQNLGGATPGLNFVETDVSGGDGRLFLKPGGNVGIGTTDPQFRLDVPTGWFRFGPGGDGGRIFAEYGPQLAPILKLSDLDDPPRIQFQEIGNGDEANPQFSAWIGMARGNSTDLALMNGNVGIGTTTPPATASINGDVALAQVGSGAARTLPAGGTLIWNDGTWLRLNQNRDYSKPNFGVHTPGVFSSGSLNIGGANSWADPGSGNVWITGNAYKNSPGFWWLPSDARLKKDIAALEGALEQVLRLRGVGFAWREPERHGATSGRYMGLVAQEVEKVFPEWVQDTPGGYKAVNPIGFEALLIEALRELNAKCEHLEAEIAELRAGRGEPKGKSPRSR